VRRISFSMVIPSGSDQLRSSPPRIRRCSVRETPP
jgi:hypothetical protein